MKTDIRYPFLFRAHPGRCVEPKDVLVPFVHTHDVPEVSRAETEEVFRSGRYVLRQFDGRLFSLLGKPGSESAQACFDHAFEPDESRSKPWWIPNRADENGYIDYVAKPLDNWAYHRLFLNGEGKARETMLWPPLIPDYSGGSGYRNRNQFTYQELEGKLRDVDAEQYHRGRAEHAVQADRLLIIGGSYWIETTPPAICVEPIGNGWIHVGFAHVPDWLDTDLGRQFFPLTAREEALDYARRAQTITENPNGEPRDYTDRADFEFDGGPAFEFDFKSYSVKRTTLILGGDMARVLSNHPDLEQKVGETRARSVYLARDAAKACSTDYQEWPDVSDLVHDVTEAWKITGRKPGWATIPAKRHGFGTLICERAFSMVDELPVAVPTATGWRPAR